MPKYTFKCKCGKELQKFANMQTKTVKCKCGKDMKRQIPTLNGPPKVTEVVNSYTNTKQIDNQKNIIKNRNDEHYWKVEVPRLVETHDMMTCLEMGWIVLDEKGKPVLQTTPPAKR